MGPVWNDGGVEKERLLKDCYKNSMELVIKNQSRTIAFPCISTGIYKFPKDLAAQIAIEVVSEFDNHKAIDEVVFVCFDLFDFELYTHCLQKESR